MTARSWAAGATALVALVLGSLLLPEPPAVDVEQVSAPGAARAP